MAYQQVKTCRFYCNVLEWGALNGALEIDDLFRTLPVNPQFTGSEFDFNSIAFNNQSFVAVLGHNLTTIQTGFAPIVDGSQAETYSDIVNSGAIGQVPSYDGFSIIEFDATGSSQVGFKITGSASGVQIGSVLIGTYWDAPHAPDLNLSLSYDYSGVKEITTRGGASLSNSFYSKSADWGTLGAWELHKPFTDDDLETEEDESVSIQMANQKLSRSGRRVWDLSFSYLSQEDTFPKYNQLTTLETGEEATNPYTGETANSMVNILPSSDDFYTQVIHKTQGQLPFIFQPDSTDNTNFAIAKFDQNSFTLRQTAPNLYSVKCRIKEVW